MIVYLFVLSKSVKGFFLLIPAVFAMTALLIFIWYCGRRDENLFQYLFFLFMVPMQIVSAVILMLDFDTWDVVTTYKNAVYLASGKGYFNETYFATCPNNLGVMFLLAGYYFVINLVFHSTSVYFGALFNIVMIDIAVLFAVKIMALLYGKQMGNYLGILSVLFAPFYLWTPIFYTDTLCMPFMMGSIYLLFCLGRKLSEEEYAKNLRLSTGFMAEGFLIFAGFKIKGSVAILLVAAVLYLFGKFDRKKFFYSVSGILLGFLLGAVLWSGAMSLSGLVSDEAYDANKRPMAHYIMMGLNGAGNYNADDVKYTASFPTYDERVQADIEVIKERLSEKGILGTVRHLFHKASGYAWNYGTFFAERYLGDYGDRPHYYSIFHEFVLTKGKCHKIFYAYTQSFWLAIFGFMAGGVFVSIFRKGEDKEMLFLKTAVAGCLAFFMIWENHPRYILHFSLVILCISVREIVFGIEYLRKKMEGMSVKFEK